MSISTQKDIKKTVSEDGLNIKNIYTSTEKRNDITEYIKEQKEEQMELYEDLKYVLYVEKLLQELQLIIPIIASGMKLYSVVLNAMIKSINERLQTMK